MKEKTEMEKQIITLLQYFVKYGEAYRKDFMEAWKGQFNLLIGENYGAIPERLLEGLIVWSETWEKYNCS